MYINITLHDCEKLTGQEKNTHGSKGKPYHHFDDYPTVENGKAWAVKLIAAHIKKDESYVSEFISEHWGKIHAHLTATEPRKYWTVDQIVSYSNIIIFVMNDVIKKQNDAIAIA